MNKLFHIEGDLRIFLLLTLWSIIVLLLMSMDSPLHHIYMRADSAWFFLGGKAMMNGMRPYVDFTDSKGPLLWLIYGIGYLLSPRNYIGVYVLSCLCYGGILYYNYKTAKLLLGDDRRSLLVALLMPWFYFLYWFHNEIRAEDFCCLPISASLYYLLHLLFQKEGQTYSVSRYGLVLGCSFMALVLIKWNLAAMHAIMIAAILWYYIRKEHLLIKPLKWLIIGMIAVGLPFIVYLTMKGSLNGFAEEYFLNTMRTVRSDDGLLADFYKELLKSWSAPHKQALLLFLCFGGWLFGRLLPYWRHLPLIICLWFYLLSTQHNLVHYYSICNVFCLFPLIHLVSLMNHPMKKYYYVTVVAFVLVWGVFENMREGSRLSHVTRWCSGRDSVNYVREQRISNSMNGVPNPRILNFFCVEYGFNVEQECLPAGKYFAYQLGTTTEMEKEHVDLMKSGKADYVLVSWESFCNSKGYTREIIESYGYQQVLREDSLPLEGITDCLSVIVYKKK